MGRSAARRVTPSLQTPLLICFLTPFLGCPAKEGLVHGLGNERPRAPHREWIMTAPGLQLTDPTTTVVPYFGAAIG